MKKILFIVVPNFRDGELFDTKAALGKDIHAQIASNTMSSISGSEASEVVPDLFIENAIPSDFDGIILIGGSGLSDVLYNDATTTQQITAQVKAFNSAGKLVAAICVSTVALAKAGIISGKKVTGWNGQDNAQKTEIEASGATFTNEPVTVDGNIITANGPASAKAFGEAIKNFFSKEVAEDAKEKDNN